MIHVCAQAMAAISQARSGSESQFFFESNADAESLVSLGPGQSYFQGGSVISSQNEWDHFLSSFQPNHVNEVLI